MVEKVVPLHDPQTILRDRTIQFIRSLENDSQNTELISSVDPSRIGVLEQSIFENYQTFSLKTQEENVDLGTYFDRTGEGMDYVLENLRSYVTEQGNAPQALWQMRALSHLLPITNPEEPAGSIYVVNSDWLRPEEYAKLLGVPEEF